MALDLNAIATKRAAVTVNFMGQSAVVKYNPSLLTQSMVDEFRQGGDEDFLKSFCKVVVDWDVKKGTKKVPLTVAGLKDVPILFMRAVYKQIMADDSEVDEQGKDSSSG